MMHFLKAFGHGLATVAALIVVAAVPALHIVVALNPIASVVSAVAIGAVNGYLAAKQNTNSKKGT